ncbi:hypothetical protein [Flavobacterium sp.]|jgi:hypothetical protein|uniref:hypothetical protein n=1 Tax=Flavobacterium sp. TaxID=239 RepID=UPI0037BF5181
MGVILNDLIFSKNNISNSWEAIFLLEEIGVSLSDVLANSFIKWHLPLHFSLGLALFTQSTLEIYS